MRSADASPIESAGPGEPRGRHRRPGARAATGAVLALPAPRPRRAGRLLQPVARGPAKGRRGRGSTSIAAMRTLLFVGAGRHQRRAILQARESGLRVVAVDRNADAPGLRLADVPEVVDFADVDAVEEVARRHRRRWARDRFGRPGRARRRDGRRASRAAHDRVRRGPPDDPQGRDAQGARRGRRAAAAVRGRPRPGERSAALETVGTPAVLKPADSGGQRAVFRIASSDDLESNLHAALAESPTREAILEGFVPGTEMNGIVIVRDGTPRVLTLSDRLRPPGIGFGVGWIHVYPASIFADQLERAERAAEQAVRALGLRDGIAFPQLIAVPDGGVAVVEVAARIPGGQMADLVRHAVGVDLVEIALLQALGDAVPDEAGRAALPAAAGDPLPHRRSGALADRHGDPDRGARPCARLRGGRAGRYVPAPRRDDPAGARRRRPPRLRDRDRRDLARRRSHARKHAVTRLRGGGRMTDSRVELVARGYDEIADRFAAWRVAIEGDPTDRYLADLAHRLAAGRPRARARVRRRRGSHASAVCSLPGDGGRRLRSQVERARRAAPGATVIEGDLLEIQCEPGSFDAVCSFNVLNHVPREKLGDLLDGIAVWLDAGGLLIASFGTGDLEAWTGTLARCGDVLLRAGRRR